MLYILIFLLPSLVIGYGIYELFNDDNGDDAIPIKHWLARMEATF